MAGDICKRCYVIWAYSSITSNLMCPACKIANRLKPMYSPTTQYPHGLITCDVCNTDMDCCQAISCYPFSIYVAALDPDKENKEIAMRCPIDGVTNNISLKKYTRFKDNLAKGLAIGMPNCYCTLSHFRWTDEAMKRIRTAFLTIGVMLK